MSGYSNVWERFEVFEYSTIEEKFTVHQYRELLFKYFKHEYYSILFESRKEKKKILIGMHVWNKLSGINVRVE